MESLGDWAESAPWKSRQTMLMLVDVEDEAGDLVAEHLDASSTGAQRR